MPALLCACVPSDVPPHPALADAGVAATAHALAGSAADWPGRAWWTAYGDPQLDRLIAEAERGAPDVAIVSARIRRADALAEEAGAELAPSLDFAAQGGFAKQSYFQGFAPQLLPHGWRDTGQATVGGSFSLDLWGRNRDAVAAATSEAEAARLDAEEARLVLSTGIATAYAELARLFVEQDIARREVELRTAILDLTHRRVANGLDDRRRQQDAEAALAVARAESDAAEERLGLQRNRIAALIGSGPDRGAAITRPVATVLRRAAPPARLPLDFIGRRPDILAARERVAAMNSRIGVAAADFYPNIDLAGFIGVQSLGLQHIIDHGALVGSVGPAISLPIFTGGRLSGGYHLANADYDLAIADYNAALVGAVREVADAETSLRAFSRISIESSRSVAASEGAYDLTRQRCDGGLATRIDVLKAEETVLSRRRDDARIQGYSIILDVALIRALGGGFDAATASTGNEGKAL